MNTVSHPPPICLYNFGVRIFFISSGLKHEYGGAAISEASLVSAIKRDVDVILACPQSRLDPKFALSVAGLQAFSFRPGATIFAYLFRAGALYREILASDLVHLNGHWRWENGVVAALCRRRGIPYVVHPRGMLWLGHRKQILKKIFNLVLGKRMVKGAAAVVALSRFELQQWTPYHLSERQTHVIPNGFTPLPPKETKPGDTYFLFVGRVEARKNLDFLVRAFADYRAEGGKFTLRLMGPEERGYGDQIRALARDLGVASEVIFESPRYGDEKWEAIRQARAVIYPTIQEAFGRVPFEAALAGTVSVAPQESGSFEYLESYFGPYFFPLAERGALTRILHGLEKFPPDEERLRQARHFVEFSLSWKAISAKFLQLYQWLRQLPNEVKKAG